MEWKIIYEDEEIIIQYLSRQGEDAEGDILIRNKRSESSVSISASHGFFEITGYPRLEATIVRYDEPGILVPSTKREE